MKGAMLKEGYFLDVPTDDRLTAAFYAAHTT
jgi:hypothetical protein